MRRPSARILIGVGLVGLVAIFLLPSLFRGDRSSAAGPASSRGGGGAFPVEVAPVTTRKVEYSVSAVGSVEAFEVVQVTARVPGAIEKMHFSEGERVKKGEVLAEIEPARYELEVATARANLEKAEAAFAEAEAGLARREGAVQKNPGLIPGEELAAWRTRVRTATAEVAAAKASLEQAAMDAHNARARAPFAGTIQTRDAQTGQYVQPGALLTTLVRREPLLLRFKLTEQDAARITPRMPARFKTRDVQHELMGATVVFGGVAATRIGISQFPDVDFPTISVSVTREGAAPEVIENDVVEILEEALVQVEGVRSITSSSRQGSANLTVELQLERDVDPALQDVQTKISQAQQRLPRDIDPPVVSKTNPEDQPIMWLGLSGPFPRQVLSDFARYRHKEKLQTIPGVGEITMGGYLERNVRIWLDAARMDERGLVVTDVIAALQREHVELPAGRLETEGREVNVRVLGEALDMETLRRIVISNTGGSPVHLDDVALVEDGFEDVRRLARVNGEPAQGIGIRKQRGANAVAVAHGVHEVLDEVRAGLPEGMESTSTPRASSRSPSTRSNSSCSWPFYSRRSSAGCSWARSPAPRTSCSRSRCPSSGPSPSSTSSDSRSTRSRCSAWRSQ